VLSLLSSNIISEFSDLVSQGALTTENVVFTCQVTKFTADPVVTWFKVVDDGDDTSVTVGKLCL